MKRYRLKSVLFGIIALLLIAWLVTNTAVREVRQEKKDRALVAAVRREDGNEIVRLLNEGANANAKDVPKDTRPFWRVCWDILRNQHPKGESEASTVLMLVLRPTMVFVGDYPAMGAPALAQNTLVVRCLLEHGANPNVIDNDPDGSAPLREACLPLYGDDAVLLMQHGAKITEIENGKPYSLLPYAAHHVHDVSILQAMLDRGADVNAQDSDGMTALMQSAVYEQVGNVRFLLAHGANVATTDPSGHTALWYTMPHQDGSPYSLKQEQIIRLLRKAGAH